MPKIYNIRWSESDSQQLSKAVRNFNAKVKRLEKKFEGQSDVVIPEKVTMKEMRDLIGTRRDLNREIKSLQKFTQRGSETLVKANTENTIYLTKWQSNELVNRANRINKQRIQRKEELENKELISRGKSLGYTRGDLGMGKADVLHLRETNAFTPKMNKSDIKWKFKHYKKESQSDYWKKRDIQTRENYIKAMQTNMGIKDTSHIVEKIRKLDIDEFLNIFNSDPEKFDVNYPINDEERIQAIEYLEKVWKVQPISKTKKNLKKSKKRAGNK